MHSVITDGNSYLSPSPLSESAFNNITVGINLKTVGRMLIYLYSCSLVYISKM